jgi:(S)-ureidoglycine aminohydrolase
MKNIKWFWILLATSLCGRAQVTNQIASNVYAWKESPVIKIEAGSSRTLVNGVATDFASMLIVGVTLEKGKTQRASDSVEEMIVVKEGSLKIAINDEAKTVGPGSVAIIMPGDMWSFSNAADGETAFYVLQYKSKNSGNYVRGMNAGGSFVMDWNDVKFVPREDGKGGTRQFFSRATNMGKRLDLHATTLEPGQASHDPHHHRAEEMIILLDADVEMYLGPAEKDGKRKRATSGDIIYLVSNEYHAIRNVGTKPALYFAFQFE